MSSWSPDAILARLEEAMRTLRRLPGQHVWPAGMKIAWPDVVREFHESYGYDAATRPRLQATAAEIQRMDEALGWVWDCLHSSACAKAGIPEDAGRVVLWRAQGLAWPAIVQIRLNVHAAAMKKGGKSAIPGGNSFPSLRKMHREALDLLMAHLGAGAAPPSPEEERDIEEKRFWNVDVTVPGLELRNIRGKVYAVRAKARWGMTSRRR